MNEDGDKNEQEEGIYEQYDGDYEKYISKNEKSSKGTNPNRGIVLQKLGKKKCWILLGILLLSIVGIAVGLSVHFTATESATTNTPILLLNATTAGPTSTTSTTTATTTTTTTTPTTTTSTTTTFITTEGNLFQTYFFNLRSFAWVF